MNVIVRDVEIILGRTLYVLNIKDVSITFLSHACTHTVSSIHQGRQRVPGNLVLRLRSHWNLSVPHFPLNFRGIVCWVAEVNVPSIRYVMVKKYELMTSTFWNHFKSGQKICFHYSSTYVLSKWIWVTDDLIKIFETSHGAVNATGNNTSFPRVGIEPTTVRLRDAWTTRGILRTSICKQ